MVNFNQNYSRVMEWTQTTSGIVFMNYDRKDTANNGIFGL